MPVALPGGGHFLALSGQAILRRNRTRAVESDDGGPDPHRGGGTGQGRRNRTGAAEPDAGGGAGQGRLGSAPRTPETVAVLVGGVRGSLAAGAAETGEAPPQAVN